MTTTTAPELTLETITRDEIAYVLLCGSAADEFDTYGPMPAHAYDEILAAHNAAADTDGDGCPGPHNLVILRTPGGALQRAL